MKDIILKKPTMSSDSFDGLNDGNIETYKNTRLLSLTKEELQNSTDQALVDENNQPKKVIVEFKDFYLDANQLPEYNETKNVYENERIFWDNYLENDKKAVKFFENALEILNAEKIRCLRISDFNTTGLCGIHKTTSSPWNNLVKNKGVSDKPGYSGGSFGIGKDAAFACSQLRIVFYNTITEDGEIGFEGCMKVPNYVLNDTTYVGRNFYCKNTQDNKCNPIEESYSLDPNYNRTEIGMDKFIIGFDVNIGKEDLKKDIIVSSIENFLTAFYMDKLEIKYDNDIINKDFLESEGFDALKESLSSLSLENYETLKKPDEIVKISMFEDDDIIIYIKLDPNYSRRASVVRQNGMKVFDRGHISSRIGFNAIVYLAKNTVNKYFKTLENQEHNSWSNERAEDPNDAKNKQNIIFDKLRAKVKELNGANTEESIDSDGLGEYLPYAYITGKKNKTEGLSNEVENTKKKVKKRQIKEQTANVEEDVNYEEDENGNLVAIPIHLGEEQNPPGPDYIPPFPNDINIENNEEGENITQVNNDGDFVSKREIVNSSLKMHLIKKSGDYVLKVISSENYKKGYFELSISGEDQKSNLEAFLENAKINGVDTKIKNNKILFNELNENILYNIEFKLQMPGEWVLEVKAYENKS